jgi:FtsP/CotA-like multicopper oxidase with cupredoxin domain
MSRAKRLSFLAIAALIAIVALVLLSGGDETDTASNPAPTATSTATREPAEAEPQPTATQTPKPPPLLQAGQEKTLTFKEGDTVRLRVRHSSAEEVHIHGYDISEDLEPNQTATISFKAGITGVFEIELEQSGALLARLKVEP